MYCRRSRVRIPAGPFLLLVAPPGVPFCASQDQFGAFWGFLGLPERPKSPPGAPQEPPGEPQEASEKRPEGAPKVPWRAKGPGGAPGTPQNRQKPSWKQQNTIIYSVLLLQHSDYSPNSAFEAIEHCKLQCFLAPQATKHCKLQCFVASKRDFACFGGSLGRLGGPWPTRGAPGAL